LKAGTQGTWYVARIVEFASFPAHYLEGYEDMENPQTEYPMVCVHYEGPGAQNIVLMVQDSLLYNPPGSHNRPSGTCPRKGTCPPPNGTITKSYGDMVRGDWKTSGRIMPSLRLHGMPVQQATQASSGLARTMAVHVASTRNRPRRQRERPLAWDDIPNVPIVFKRLLNPGRKIRTTSPIP
jgi:hypothetical protein